MSLATVSHAPDGLGSPPSSGGHGVFGRLVRRRGLRELLFIAFVYSLYDGSRFFVEGKQNTAFMHAFHVLNVEKGLNIAWEQTLNQVVSSHAWLAVSADYMYATLHYLVTPIVLIWMWRRHRDAYSRARTTLLVATIIGLIGFSLMPVAPPRMLPGFVDTMAQYSGFGLWGGEASVPRGFGSFTNQFAAMPSLHVGWALWCGWQLVRHGQHRVTRWMGVLYPTLISLVVMATGNHYLLDAVAGFAVVFFAMVAVWGVAAARARLLPRRVIDLTAAEASIPLAREPRG